MGGGFAAYFPWRGYCSTTYGALPLFQATTKHTTGYLHIFFLHDRIGVTAGISSLLDIYTSNIGWPARRTFLFLQYFLNATNPAQPILCGRRGSSLTTTLSVT